jgi:tRNA nucleotidyltransferase (CCA-adding enzyme)
MQNKGYGFKMNLTNLKKDILASIKPSENEEKEIRKKVNHFLDKINSEFKKSRIIAKAIVGGSFAKGTTIKKDRYDVDIFAVFDKKYDSDKISGILEKTLKRLKIKADKLPGSRDYFSISQGSFKLEVVPVMAANKPSEAKNITDLSLLHVKYITKEVKKNKNLGNEIKLVKALCYANNCYGAESHIKGFSGYCLELLTSYYGSFENLIKAAGKWKGKVIIDAEKYYKGKNVLAELNEAKTMSPLILIDPVQKDRNAAAALSIEKFNVFTGLCKKFSKNPSKKAFERKIIDENKIIQDAKKERAELFKIIAKSGKIKEDTAGSKLLKLLNLIKKNIEKEGYKVKEHWDFKNKEARMWFSVKKAGKTVRQGPMTSMKEHVSAFKKHYKKTFVKNNRIFAYAEPKQLNDILSIDKKQLSQMGISYVRIENLIPKKA